MKKKKDYSDEKLFDNKELKKLYDETRALFRKMGVLEKTK